MGRHLDSGEGGDNQKEPYSNIEFWGLALGPENWREKKGGGGGGRDSTAGSAAGDENLHEARTKD